MKTTRVIAVINQKGGVGKTTTTANIAHGLSINGFDVLAIDLDPQSQLTSSLGLRQQNIQGIEMALTGEKSLLDVLYPVREKLMLAPAGSGLYEIERLDTGGASRGMLLKKALKDEISDFDYVLIDCPPSSGLLVVNAIFATREVLIPMTGDYLAMQGLSHLMSTLRNFEQALNHIMKQWIVIGRYTARRRLSNDVKDSLVNHFPGKVLKTIINESVTIAESPSYGKTIFDYRPSCRSAMEFGDLVQDLILGRVH